MAIMHHSRHSVIVGNVLEPLAKVVEFLPRDAMLVRYMLSSRVCLFVIRQYHIETTGWIELFFWREGSTYSIYATLCCKESRVSPKMRVLPSGTLSQTLDFKKCRHSKSTVELVNHTYDGQRVVAGRT